MAVKKEFKRSEPLGGLWGFSGDKEDAEQEEVLVSPFLIYYPSKHPFQGLIELFD